MQQDLQDIKPKEQLTSPPPPRPSTISLLGAAASRPSPRRVPRSCHAAGALSSLPHERRRACAETMGNRLGLGRTPNAVAPAPPDGADEKDSQANRSPEACRASDTELSVSSFPVGSRRPSTLPLTDGPLSPPPSSSIGAPWSLHGSVGV